MSKGGLDPNLKPKLFRDFREYLSFTSDITETPRALVCQAIRRDYPMLSRDPKVWEISNNCRENIPVGGLENSWFIGTDELFNL
jgi:hypothetical protein